MYINSNFKVQNCILNCIKAFAKELVEKVKIGWDIKAMSKLEIVCMIMIACDDV